MHRLKNPTFLEISLLVLVVILQFIWPLPHTIAIRNFCLIGGGFISLLLILFYYKPHQINHHVPLMILLGVPIWLYFHYLWIPVDLKLQWYDLSGTWLRVTLGILIAYSLGRIFIDQPRWAKWILFPYLLLAIIATILYAETAIQLHKFVVQGFTGIFKTKISGAYFMVFTCLISYGLILTLNSNSHHKQTSRGRFLTFCVIICICLSFTNCLLIQSLIGVAVCTLMGLTCVLFILFKNKNAKLLALMLLTSLLALFVLFINYDAKYEGKLANLKNDTLISLDINKNKAWTKTLEASNIPLPKDQIGRVINGSTYERTSWLIKGSQLLIDHPLGTGFSWSAFKYYMTAEFPGSQAEKTHSGWLDFALGVGFPGLLLTWVAIVLTLKKAIRELKGPTPNSSAWIVIFILIGISLLWLVGEVCEREFIEHFFFMIALSASYFGHLENKIIDMYSDPL